MRRKKTLQLIREGKTKNLYDDECGNYKLLFKDEVTGTDGKFDPGANTIGLTLKGSGLAGLRMSVYYFKLLESSGFCTHYRSCEYENNMMIVVPATPFGNGLEVICRYVALGSFIRRYGSIVEENHLLPGIVEVTLKDDERGDPLINEETLRVFGILKSKEYSKLSSLTKDICGTIRRDLSSKELDLCDIKLEFGRDVHGNIMLIDEIAAGNMRVRKGGRFIEPLELTELVIS